MNETVYDAGTSQLVSDKIGELRKRLLDFSRRNPLVHLAFTPRSANALRVVDELPDVLRHKLVQGEPMRFVPLPALDNELPDEATRAFQDALALARHADEEYLAQLREEPERDDQAEFDLERWLRDRVRADLGLLPRQTKEKTDLAAHARNHGISPEYALPTPDDIHEDGRHEDSDIQTLLLPDRFSRVAKSIVERGRGFERETGVNVLHGAFGILEWQGPGDRTLHRSPLLLLEIRMDRRQSVNGAEFTVHGTDAVAANTTLAEKLGVEHGLELPDYQSGDVEAYFETIRDNAPDGWVWTVRREVSFGVFPSSRTAMYHDLDPGREGLVDHPLVTKLLATSGGGPSAYAEDYGTDDAEVVVKVPFLVRDADSSQFAALVDAADGRSIALEGPPGSGKSQTIVNMIAGTLAAGRRVLFVAEKLTALEVVRARLEAVGLGEFVLPLQAGKASSENVYLSLEDRLELSSIGSVDEHRMEARRAAMEKRKRGLQSYLDALGSTFGKSGECVYDVLGHAIATSEVRDELPRTVQRARIPHAEALSRITIDEIVSDVGAFADRLGRSKTLPKIWCEARSTVLHRDLAEDAADEAGELAEAVEAAASRARKSRARSFLGPSPLSRDAEGVALGLAKAQARSATFDLNIVERLLVPQARRSAENLAGLLERRVVVLDRLRLHLKEPLASDAVETVDHAYRFASEQGQRIAPAEHSRKATSLSAEALALSAFVSAGEMLPERWTDRDTLAKVQAGARRLMKFSVDVRSVRIADASRQLPVLASELVSRVRKLESEGDRLRRRLRRASDKQDAQQVHQDLLVISQAGMFRFLSSTYKLARTRYSELYGGPGDASLNEMTADLTAFVTWLGQVRDFASDTRFKLAFGPRFEGIHTAIPFIEELGRFHTEVNVEAAGRDDLRHVLETTDLAAIEQLAAMTDAPDLTLVALKGRAAKLKSEAAAETDLRERAQTLLAGFNSHEAVTLGEIERCAAGLEELRSLDQEIAALPDAQMLGPRYRAERTDRGSLAAEIAIADELDSADGAGALAVLRRDGVDEIVAELGRLGRAHRELRAKVDAFIDRLDLPWRETSLDVIATRTADLRAASADRTGLIERTRLRMDEERLREVGLAAFAEWAVMQAQEDEIDLDRLPAQAQALLRQAMADRVLELHRDALASYNGEDFDRIRREIAEADRALIDLSREAVRQRLIAEANPPAGNNVGRKSGFTQMGLLNNELNKRKRRVGVRELTRRAGEALVELKPCWMMSPLAVAQYLQGHVDFDLLVIDEASQMTPENAIGAVSRVGQAVVVGDTKQLPPTNFFRKMLDDSDVDEDLVEDAESVLDMANAAFSPVRQLRWHYRSRHAALIQFSNHWMYDDKLTIFPSPRENDPQLGVASVEVDGVYVARTNVKEAQAVVRHAVEHMHNHPELSLGVCTMNGDQRDLILEEFEVVRDRDPRVRDYIARWEEENDGLEEFFVKNLETIQGDERDVMFISTLYGPATPGARVMQRFGPINSVHGHRRLNVLFSRAKQRIVTFTSMRPSDIAADETKAKGVRMLQAWLEYSRTGTVPQNAHRGGPTDSPFEDHVVRQIEAMGCEAVPQVGVAGYRIDIGVRHPDWPYGFVLGVECDGATYHSSKSSRDRDRLRQEVLENLGWRLHRIWSTDWFNDRRTQNAKLREAIDAAVAAAKRDAAPIAPKPRATVEQKPNGANGALPSNDSGGAGLRPRQQQLFETVPSEDLFRERSVATPAKRSAPHNAETARTVGVGSTVRVEEVGGGKLAFRIVRGAGRPEEGEVGEGAPLARALMDAEVGDEVEYQAGSRIKEVRVLAIEQT